MKTEIKSYLSPQEVASLLMVSPVTVRQWAQKGILKAELTFGGHRRFLRTDVEQLMRANSTAAKTSPKREKTARVLIVDDDQQLAGYIRELLSELPDIQVEISNTGYEAGFQVLRFAPQLILLDLMMKGLDGFEVCRRIKSDEMTRDIRVIAMTGYVTAQNVEGILAAGAEACLAKPIDAAGLLHRVRYAPLEVAQDQLTSR